MSNQFENADQAAEALLKAYQNLNASVNPSKEAKAIIEEVDFCDSIINRLDEITQELDDRNSCHSGQIVF